MGQMSGLMKSKRTKKQREVLAPNGDAKVVTAASLRAAWVRYHELLGEVPHGTIDQLAALLELVKPAGRELLKGNGE